jgi:hypothetical protein
MRIYLALLVGLSCLPACGSDDGGDGGGASGGTGGQTAQGVCQLDASLSGAVEETVAWDEQDGCGGNGDATAQNVVLAWGVVIGLNVKLTIGSIAPGSTGSHSGFVEVHDDKKLWRTGDAGCTIDVTKFETIEGDTYAIAGTGSCAGSLGPVEGGASGTITLGDFSFETTVAY